MPRTVTILGSTGSVGESTLDLLDKAGADAEIVALTAGRNVERLAVQAKQWGARVAVIEDESLLPELKQRLNGSNIGAAAGPAAIAEAAAMGADWVMSAIVGSAGLAPTLAAAKVGSTIALANKESLICAGPALLATAEAAGGEVIPVDSEHSAIFQVLQPGCRDRVARLILTASGGPFRGWTRAQMASVTVVGSSRVDLQACKLEYSIVSPK